jgi:hypothetical protein
MDSVERVLASEDQDCVDILMLIARRVAESTD